MSVNITSYTGLSAAVQAWMARAGDTLLSDRFDDFLALHEQRMYYGAAAIPGLLPQFEPLRIREMETVDAAFAISAETVAQPTGFLELIEASLNSPEAPLRIEHQGVIASYGEQTLSTAKIIAISGTNFRFKEASGTATLRYYQKLTTPTASTANWILQNAPGVYLNGCLIEAALMTSDFDTASRYATIYAAHVGGLNQRRNRELAGATNVRTRVRGRTP
jgi:hypothetical protein